MDLTQKVYCATVSHTKQVLVKISTLIYSLFRTPHTKDFAVERHLNGGFSRKVFPNVEVAFYLVIKTLQMNKLKGLAIGALLFVPFVSFAQTDDQIRASLVQQLLSVFVVQVNGIDKMQSIAAQSSNPAQFSSFNTLLQQQLSETTNQLATLLNGDTATVSVTPSPIPSQTTLFGGVSPAPAPVDQSAIIVIGKNSIPGSGIPNGVYGYEARSPDAVNGMPFGQWGWTVWVKDSSGNFVKNAPVTMSIGPVDDTPDFIKNSPNDSSHYYTSHTNGQSGSVSTAQTITGDWNTAFQYIPTVVGTKTVTFSSGSLSTQVTAVVQ